MATRELTSTLRRADHAVSRPAPTPSFHLARMQSAESAARSISVRRSVGSIPAGELVEALAIQESYSLLAAAHRAAARRLQRGRRLRLRAGLAFGPVVRVVSEIRWAVRRVVA